MWICSNDDGAKTAIMPANSGEKSPDRVIEEVIIDTKKEPQPGEGSFLKHLLKSNLK
jgi:hypothetical protein